MSEPFYRMKRLPPYVIAEVNAMRHAARQEGRDIIDLGMGNPDQPPPQHVIDKMCEVAQKPDAHGYSQSKGIPGLRRAQANYYANRFGVELDPETEVVVTMGSKEGLASMATAVTAPGDVVLAPSPSYPIHTFGFIIAGATIRSVPTTPDARYWQALDNAMAFTVPRPTMQVVNYPSNPPAEVVDVAFYQKIVDWAKENQVWVLSDLAYSELYFDGNPTPSIMQAKGAKDVAVEFTSMSKTFSMAGWRMGFAVGNKNLISALTRVKSYLDYGAFTPIQAAACAALNGPQQVVEDNRVRYHKRRDVMVEAFGRAGWDIPAPAACLHGRRYQLALKKWAVSNFPSNCWSTPKSRLLPVLATAKKAKGSSGSPWSRTSSVCVRPHAILSVFSKAARHSAYVARPSFAAARKAPLCSAARPGPYFLFSALILVGRQ